MAEASRLVSSAAKINQIPTSFQSKLNPPQNVNIKIKAASRKHEYSSLVLQLLHPSTLFLFLLYSHFRLNTCKVFNGLQINKKDSRSSRRRLITISTADGRWQGTWSCDYLVSLRDLNLNDLIEDDEEKKDALVSINLCIHKVKCQTPYSFLS